MRQSDGDTSVPVEAVLLWCFEALARAAPVLAAYATEERVMRARAKLRSDDGRPELVAGDPQTALWVLGVLGPMDPSPSRVREWRNILMHRPDQIVPTEVCEHLGRLADIVSSPEVGGDGAPAADDIRGLAATFEHLQSAAPIAADQHTLIVMPCSSKKLMPGRRGLSPSPPEHNPPLGGCLGSDAERLLAEVRCGTGLDPEAGWALARDLYVGSAWHGTGLRAALRAPERTTDHVLIASGGYGLLRHDEWAAYYDCTLTPSRWRAVVAAAIQDYCVRHRIGRVLWFGSATAGGPDRPRTTPDEYTKLARAVNWQRFPHPPRVITIAAVDRLDRPWASDAPVGEAIAALLRNGSRGTSALPAGWMSRAGAVLAATVLSG